MRFPLMIKVIATSVKTTGYLLQRHKQKTNLKRRELS